VNPAAQQIRCQNSATQFTNSRCISSFTNSLGDFLQWLFANWIAESLVWTANILIISY
jgi:hypothetical protein